MSQTAYVITGQRQLTAVDAADTSTVLPGHAVVEIAYTGICASDVDAYKKGYPYHPTLSGHEWSGTVTAVGSDVGYLAPGDRVARTSQPPCGTCRMCLAGHQNRCDFFSSMTVPTAAPHGAYTRRLQVPARSLVRLPGSVTLEQGALVEPATVALHGVRRSEPRLGDTVVVFGVGIVGIFATQFARLCGAVNVVVVDPDAERLAGAVDLGATVGFAPDDPELERWVLARTGGRGADIAYECSGQGTVIGTAVTLLRPGGNLVLISAPAAPVELFPVMWIGKHIDILTSRAHNREEFDITVDLLARALLQTTGGTGYTVGLSELPAVFEQLAEKPSALKVLVDPTR